MDRVGYVYFNELFAGVLSESADGFIFIYDAEYILNGTPIGFNYPLEQQIYRSAELFPVFENLVSEGWLLKLQSRMQHLDESDKFGLLLNNGKDLIGAITIHKEKL